MVSDDGTVDEESTEQQQTLSEQDNAATKEQVDKIEGNTEATTETQQQTDDALIEDSPTLYRTQDTLSYKGSYENLKKAVTYINGQTGRMTVDNITMTFDSGSGGLTRNNDGKYLLHEWYRKSVQRTGCRNFNLWEEESVWNASKTKITKRKINKKARERM